MAALPITVRLNANDNVVVARVDLLPGAEVEGLAVTQRSGQAATRPIPLASRCAFTDHRLRDHGHRAV